MASSASSLAAAKHDRMEPIELFKEAVILVTTDEGFRLPAVLARSALTCAEKLLTWMPEHQKATCKFADQLIGDLRGCFHASKSMRVRKEKMWENYFKLRSADGYTVRWATFLESSIATQAYPIFFQYVTDKVMEKLIKEHFALPPSSAAECSRSPAPLECLDKKALRYTVGSSVRALEKKVEKGANPLKKSLLLCLNDIREDGGYQNIALDHESDDWTDLIDRGGLIHISDTLFNFFCVVEMEYRCNVHDKCAEETEGMRSRVVKKLLEDDDVLFYWSMVAVNWEQEESDALLELFMHHWFTVRGFSYAGSFIELYKKRHHTSLQKSKGLRKKLNCKTEKLCKEAVKPDMENNLDEEEGMEQ